MKIKSFFLETTYGKLFLMWFLGIVVMIAFTGILIISTNYWEYILLFFKACMFIAGPILIGGCIIGHKLFPENPRGK